jgi:hypothetical protein
VLDVTDCLDVMRSHSTEWLEARRGEVVAEVRRLQAEEHSILLVLDERGRVDVSRGLDGESARTVRDKLETARALESLPAVAAAAAAGELSAEQLHEVVKFADEESDAELARQAPSMTPADLARLAREQRKPTVEEGQARHGARQLRTRQDKSRGMSCGRFELPDVMGAKFDATIQRLVQAMRPPKGQPWSGGIAAPPLRDQHCRCGNCDLNYGLQGHHIRPRSWGGSDEISNLVAVASVHHPMLIPNGPYAIVGNPNLPDGLRTVHIDDLTPEEAKRVGLPPRRAGPDPPVA